MVKHRRHGSDITPSDEFELYEVDRDELLMVKRDFRYNETIRYHNRTSERSAMKYIDSIAHLDNVGPHRESGEILRHGEGPHGLRVEVYAHDKETNLMVQIFGGHKSAPGIRVSELHAEMHSSEFHHSLSELLRERSPLTGLGEIDFFQFRVHDFRE